MSLPITQPSSNPHPIISHFSHRHPLSPVAALPGDAICFGCNHLIPIGSPAHACTKPNCPFLIHDICLDLPRRVRHPIHPHHMLNIRWAPPYPEREFTCNACGEHGGGHGFTYRCGTCKEFNLHVECASLPEVEERDDHDHPLKLKSGEMEAQDWLCYVCGEGVEKGVWKYGCLECKCVSHLECAMS